MFKSKFAAINKKAIICLLLLCVLGMSNLFAGDSIAVLDNAGNKILDLVGATWVKALLVVALIIEFGVIAFGNAQGEGGIIKKVLPWIIGTAGILGATSIVNFFFSGIKSESLETGMIIEQVEQIVPYVETFLS